METDDFAALINGEFALSSEILEESWKVVMAGLDGEKTDCIARIALRCAMVQIYYCRRVAQLPGYSGDGMKGLIALLVEMGWSDQPREVMMERLQQVLHDHLSPQTMT